MVEFEKEEVIEQKLIRQLTEGESQWTLAEDIHSVDDLWQNFRKRLVSNNKEIFDEHPLTDTEFQQVKNQLQFPSFYDAALWLQGENGIARVHIVRDDASLGTVRPVVFRRADIAGGSTVYQVVHQIRVKKLDKMGINRRGDVTLLINGLPVIQIELKNRSVAYKKAFNQIKNYQKEGVYRDIFSSIQMFVVSNGTDTRYIAAAPADELNEKFLSQWLDDDNKPVTNYLAFAKSVLSIPAAHRMVSQYTVLDSERKSLILLRPYQIHAIEAIQRAANPYQQADSTSQEKTPGVQSGYIWHTTGSGKTLTAYKVAHNLAQIPSIEKVVFVVDRKDLDNQTTGAFQAYAEYDTIDVKETSFTYDLVKKLHEGKKNVLVTTIQKIQNVIRKYPEGTKEYDWLHKLRLVFVVDECHRAVSPAAQKDINEYFSRPLWYGFTGTPIFAEDKKNSAGDLPKTTAQQYGLELNRYTVKEAIHDGSVLGFQVEYHSTFDMEEMARKHGIDIPDADGAKLEQALDDKGLLANAYQGKKHMRQVVNFIINRANEKMALYHPKGKSYSAILTTSSIEQAQEYYKMFQRVKRGEEPGVQIGDKTKRRLSDFPRVAITYSLTENDEKSQANQNSMKKSLKDYNEMFGTAFGLDNIDSYNANVNDRLARKESRYKVRDQQLDIVIVVNRLLTGFDAPSLSTLFIDRRPMRSYDIIQAFSRTNRIFDEDKKFGQIVIFQVPALFKKAVDSAITLYSAGGGDAVQAPTWKEAEKAFREALQKLQQIAVTPEDVDGLSKEQKKDFLKAYSKFDSALADMRVYSEFQDVKLSTDYGITDSDIEEFTGKFNNIKEELKEEKKPEEEDEIDLDVDYELRCVHRDQIDEEYILRLMEATRSGEGYLVFTKADDPRNAKLVQVINEEIERYERTSPARAAILKKLWSDYQANPTEFIDRRFTDVMSDRIQAACDNAVNAFAKEWCVDADALSSFLSGYDTSIPLGEKQLDQDALRKASNPREYKKTHPDIGLKYWGSLLAAARQLYIGKIQPLIEK